MLMKGILMKDKLDTIISVSAILVTVILVIDMLDSDVTDSQSCK